MFGQRRVATVQGGETKYLTGRDPGFLQNGPRKGETSPIYNIMWSPCATPLSWSRNQSSQVKGDTARYGNLKDYLMYIDELIDVLREKSDLTELWDIVHSFRIYVGGE